MPTHETIAVSVKRAAELLSISRAKLYELIKSGELEIRKCGSRTLIRYQDLQHLIDTLPIVKPEGVRDA